MFNPLALKLEQFVRLSADDRLALSQLTNASTKIARSHADIFREGDSPRGVLMILEGWACRYKQLEDGRRQIMSLFIPGDLCDLNVFILRKLDHSMAAIGPVRYAELHRDALEALTVQRPRVTQALWWDALVTAAIQREWTVSLGRRSALERIAHLVCELFVRARAVGLTSGNSFACPLTQADLADLAGMTQVHVNRTVQEIRARGLVEWRSRNITIPDWNALQLAGMFNPDYLHLGHDGASLDAND